MYDSQLLLERLQTVQEALHRIPRRFAEIQTPEDFTASDAGLDRMDAILGKLIPYCSLKNLYIKQMHYFNCG